MEGKVNNNLIYEIIDIFNYYSFYIKSFINIIIDNNNMFWTCTSHATYNIRVLTTTLHLHVSICMNCIIGINYTTVHAISIPLLVTYTSASLDILYRVTRGYPYRWPLKRWLHQKYIRTVHRVSMATLNIGRWKLH